MSPEEMKVRVLHQQYSEQIAQANERIADLAVQLQMTQQQLADLRSQEDADAPERPQDAEE